MASVDTVILQTEGSPIVVACPNDAETWKAVRKPKVVGHAAGRKRRNLVCLYPKGKGRQDEI